MNRLCYIGGDVDCRRFDGCTAVQFAASELSAAASELSASFTMIDDGYGCVGSALSMVDY